MSQDISTCALCPRLCRPVCPVAIGTHREAAVPAVIAGVVLQWRKGNASSDLAAEAATLCTDCGACQDWCHVDQPLPALLRAARTELLPPPLVEPLRAVQGQARTLVIEADGRTMTDALSARLRVPLSRLFTVDQLGVALIGYPAWAERAEALRALLAPFERVIIADGGVSRALSAVGVDFEWLHEVLPELAGGLGSCACPDGKKPLNCCGAAPPLSTHHGEDARRVGRAWLERAESKKVLDARCRNHLLTCGGLEVTDVLDALLDLG